MSAEDSDLILRMIATGFAEASGEVRALSGEVDTLSRSSLGAAGNMDKAAKKTGVWSKMTSGLNNVMSGGSSVIAMLALGFSIDKVMKAGQNWTAQQAQLQNALHDTGEAHKGTLNQLTDSADSLSIHGGYAAPENLSALATFVRLTGKAKDSITLMAAATNLARGADVPFLTIQNDLQAAMAGRARGLQKYLPLFAEVKTAEIDAANRHQQQIDQLATEASMMGSTGAIWLRTQTEKIDATYRLQQVHAQMMDKQAQATEMVQMIEKRYAGATVAYSKTMAGAWSNTVNGIELLAKSLSKILTPVLTVVFKGILAVVGALISMLNWAGKNKAVVIAAVAPILAYVAAMKALAFAAMLSKLRIGEWLTVQKASDIVNGASAAEVGILTAAQAAYVVGIEAATVAGEDLSIAQKGWIAVQALFNAVMDANPIMLVVIAVAALAAGIVYAYEHVAFFRNAAQAVFEWLKGAVSAVIGFVAKHWQLIVSILGGPFIALPLFVATHFALVLKFLEGIGHDIASVGSTIWDGLKDGFIDVINFIIKAFNAIPFIHGFHVGPVDVPGIPRIGLIAEGSSSTPASARGGAASVASPAARVLGREAAQARAESASGGMFAPPLVHVHTTFKLAGKDFARGAAIAQSQLKAAT